LLSKKILRENYESVREGLANRNYKPDDMLKNFKELDGLYKNLNLELEKLKSEQNRASKLIGEFKFKNQDNKKEIIHMKELANKIKKLDLEVREIKLKLKEILIEIPNVPNINTPVGKSESDNKIIRTVGEIKKYDFKLKTHWELGEALKILDFNRAAKISGSRFVLYKNLGARLERALINFMLDTHIKKNYQEVFTPFIVNSESMFGTGQLPKFQEDLFKIKDTNYFLIPTAEVPVTNIHRDEILDGKELTKRYCAYSACFRAEAGAAGKDTRGLIRQHEFNKVELVKFCRPEDSYQELESLTHDAEEILKLLCLPYRVIKLCTGDLGFSSAMTYDIEVWMPSYNKYIEISSCSNFEEFQARRANIKFKDSAKNKAKFVHTLNGSGLAIGRTVAAILENFQMRDGKIKIPEVLIKYIGCEFIE